MKDAVNEERPLHEYGEANPDTIPLIAGTPVNDEEHAHQQRYV